MSVEANKQVVRLIFDEVISQGQLELLDELLAQDLIDTSNPPGWPEGREGARQIIAHFRAAFAGWHCVIEDMIAEGDTVVLRAIFRGTHTGEFLGIPPTGRRASWQEIHIGRYAAGKLVEHWGQRQMLQMLQQLGALPAPAPPTLHHGPA